MSTRLSPAALFLRLFVIALAGGPILATVALPGQTGSYRPTVLALLAGSLLCLLVSSIRLPRLRPPVLEAVPLARPVSGLAKLAALLVMSEPPAVRSLTGPAVVAVDPVGESPVLCDLEPPSRLRLLAEGFLLFDLSLIWVLGVTWAALDLPVPDFVGLLMVVLGCGSGLVTLLARFGWTAGSFPASASPAGIPVWGAPLIPAQGPQKFRGTITPDGRRILVRPDILAAPYLPYLIAHEEGHISLRNFRAIWLETGLFLVVMSGSGWAVITWGLVGFLPLLLLVPLRLGFVRYSYRTELAVDARVLAALGAEACLGALGALAAQSPNPTSPLPRWYRHSPTIHERIDHIQQKV
ncbi:MAG TPA: hypothetical protein VK191_03565 [Symbiobacteriaceae bacterium]|nr:hypothetical protein [Symbiobacteriaceae bacterium]